MAAAVKQSPPASPTAEFKPESYGNFDLTQRVKLDYADISVQKWVSRETGLSVVHLDYESPIVKGYFVVPTEIFNDSGCPHTLEQFLQLLPVYIDHILYPTITDAGFVTEVHHINGNGEDAGVVYAEMQGREQTPGDLMALKSQRLFYPPSSAYKSETGGLMEALRVLTAQDIRNYHASYYVPHNLCLIVAGKVSTTDLLDVLQNKVEPNILEHGQKGAPAGWKRPFLETPSVERPVIEKIVKDIVEFPEKDESMGEIVLSQVGPEPSDYLARKAIDILGIYLTDSPVAPLTKEYVEIPSPLCTYIYFAETTRASFISLDVYFGSVPTEHLSTLDEKFRKSLQNIAKDGIDMERMRVILKRERLKLMNSIEAGGGDVFAMGVIGDFLYGAKDGSELKPAMAEIKRFADLETWTSQQWVDLLTKYYISNPYVAVRAKPSALLPAKLETEEKARIDEQKARLGPAGLKHLAKVLEDAKKEHEKEIPKEVLTSFPVPDVKSIRWIDVQSARNEPSGDKVGKNANVTSAELDKHIASDKTEVPFFVEFDHVQSSFVTISAYLSTAEIPERLRPYLSAYLSSFYSLPVTRSDGTKLTHEEVVNQLDDLTVSYDTGLGIGDYFCENVRLSIKVEIEQYETAVAWLKDLIFGSEFTKDRLEVTIAKIQQSLPELKRDGSTVSNAVNTGLFFKPTSSYVGSTILSQMEVIPRLAKELQDSPEAVIKDFETLRELVTKPTGVRFSVTGNVLAVPQPRKPWSLFDKLSTSELHPPPFSKDYLTELGKAPVKKAVVLTLPTIESSFGVHTAKGIVGWDHPEYPALRVACEVLDGIESFLWRYIRGSGLAYGSNMSIDLESGLVGFTVFRAPDAYKAYAEGLKVVRGLTDGSIPMDEISLDGAKSSLVYSVTRSVSSPGRAALEAFTNQTFRGVPADNARRLLERLQNVTLDDVKGALQKYILPLFDPESSVAVIVSGPSKSDSIAEQLKSAGFDVERRTLDVGPDEDGSGSEETGSESSEEESGR
ncbi:hypothetical protein FRC02_010043 [Tulasnella sp. 418]|nr:hypothetical protein FRC02_010043 [Tulasnella sp. 418]